MNLLAIARRVKSESGRSGNGPAAVATATDNDLRIVNAVRDAWLEVQAEPRHWRWMRKRISAGVLTAGATAYTGATLGLDADNVAAWWPEIDHYSPTAYDAAAPDRPWRLQFVEYERFRQAFLVGAHQAAAPQFWSHNGAQLLIGPAPDGLVSYRIGIDYQQEPTELVADGDEPDMPKRFHRLLIWKALSAIATADGSQEHYVRANDNADDVFNALVTSEAERITFGHRPLA